MGSFFFRKNRVYRKSNNALNSKNISKASSKISTGYLAYGEVPNYEIGVNLPNIHYDFH